MTYIKVHYIPLLFCGCGSGNCNSVVFISDNTSSSSPPSCHSPFPEMGRSSPSCSSFPEMGRSSPSCFPFPEMGRSSPSCSPFPEMGRSSPSCSPFPEMGRSSPSCSSFPEMGRSSPSCSSFPEMGRSLFPVCNLFLVASCFDLLLFSLAVDNSGLGYKLIIIINKLLLSP